MKIGTGFLFVYVSLCVLKYIIMELNPLKIIENIKTTNKVSHDREKEPAIGKIMASIIDLNNIDIYTKKMIQSIKKNATNIDFHENPDFMEKNNLITSDNEKKLVMHWSTYVMSSCDEKDKYSEGYQDCTGIVLVGKDKNSGKNISFLSHQLSRGEDLADENNDFNKDLLKNTNDFLEKVDEKTVDALIFGGSYLLGEEKYKKSIISLGKVLKDSLNFEPVVLTGPNFAYGRNDISFDTQNRRLFLVRPAQPIQKNDPTNQN